MTLFSEFIFQPENEIHVILGDLFFESRKIITDRGSYLGIQSFAYAFKW